MYLPFEKGSTIAPPDLPIFVVSNQKGVLLFLSPFLIS